MMGDDDKPDTHQPHDPSGLYLALDIARSYKNTANRPARRRKPSSDASRGPTLPDPGQPQQISDIMARLVQQRGWEKDLAVHRVFTEWPAVVGQDVAEHCVPVEYVDGEVTVQADSTAWATQITLLAPRIVAKLNEQLGDGTVVRINVKAPNGPTWKKGFRTVRGQRGPRDTYG
ncbi:MAG: hypothetical protein JWP10_5 [Nocardioidaceae bacterium]|nr:hypothetical protein [Nocardioidaceae bacterium]